MRNLYHICEENIICFCNRFDIQILEIVFSTIVVYISVPLIKFGLIHIICFVCVVTSLFIISFSLLNWTISLFYYVSSLPSCSEHAEQKLCCWPFSAWWMAWQDCVHLPWARAVKLARILEFTHSIDIFRNRYNDTEIWRGFRVTVLYMIMQSSIPQIFLNIFIALHCRHDVILFSDEV